LRVQVRGAVQCRSMASRCRNLLAGLREFRPLPPPR
jgi:hypothetical protein